MTAHITVDGGLTAQPDLRYSQSGVAIASGTVASTERYQKDGEWRDGKKLFLRWSAFKDLAENIAASQLDKGAQVTISGKLHTREYQDRDGANRTSTELEVTDFSVSLKRAVVEVTKSAPAVSARQNQAEAAAFAGDSWATTQPSYGDESPF